MGSWLPGALLRASPIEGFRVGYARTVSGIVDRVRLSRQPLHRLRRPPGSKPAVRLAVFRCLRSVFGA